MTSSSPVYIIAEAGVNHNGCLDTAERLIDAAKAAGADAVKFQTFRADSLVSKSAKKAAYQQQTTDAEESQYQMIKNLELNEEAHVRLRQYCVKSGIEFLSTPFDLESVDLLVKLGVSRLKIPSGELTNAPLILKVAQTGLPLILSTGMATLAEVEQALQVIAYGIAASKSAGTPPSRRAFADAYTTASALEQTELNRRVTLLHCTTEYPAPVHSVNLRAMDTLRHAFGLSVGYSDHTQGITIPIAAVARGAVLIEKHFTLDRTMPGPDHKASLEPPELAAMVRGIRETEAALGSPRKVPAASEIRN
ncbi:MAG: N-acetylneuraminate synthase, partial [Candidatus Methylacidiphilales bacterium]